MNAAASIPTRSTADPPPDGVDRQQGDDVEADLHQRDRDRAAPENAVDARQKEGIERRQVAVGVQVGEAGVAVARQQIDGVVVVAGGLQG